MIGDGRDKRHNPSYNPTRGYRDDEFYKRSHDDPDDDRGLRSASLGSHRRHNYRGRPPLSARTLEGIRRTRWEKLKEGIPSIEGGLDKIKTSLARLERSADELKKAEESYRSNHAKLRQFLSGQREFDLSEIAEAYSNYNLGYNNAADYQVLHGHLEGRLKLTRQVLKDSITENLEIIKTIGEPSKEERASIETLRNTTQRELTETLNQLSVRFDAIKSSYSKTDSGKLSKDLHLSKEELATLAKWTEPVFKKREEDIRATMEELSKYRDDIIDQAHEREDREAVQTLYEAMHYGKEVFFTAIRDLKACSLSREARKLCEGREQKYGTQFRDDVEYLHWYLEVAWPPPPES